MCVRERGWVVVRVRNGAKRMGEDEGRVKTEEVVTLAKWWRRTCKALASEAGCGPSKQAAQVADVRWHGNGPGKLEMWTWY